MVTNLTRAGFTVVLAGIAAALLASCSSEPAGTPIQWSDLVGRLENQQPGQMHRLQCPPNGTVGAAYGHDIYTADTSLCTAAAHSGVITVDRGGSFAVEILPAQRFFGASVRNNITTTAYGNYRLAFRVVTPNRATGGAFCGGSDPVGDFRWLHEPERSRALQGILPRWREAGNDLRP
jgi:hypothetical protein